MPRYKCNSCGGAYVTPQAGGVVYYHACPPHANPDFQPVLDKPGYDSRETLEHPDKRDENIRQDPVTFEVTVISEGKGRTKLAD